MENDQESQHLSGSTSPTDSRSLTSGEGTIDEYSTLIGTHGSETASQASFIHPPVPVNTPATQSVVDGISTTNIDNLAERLSNVPTASSPPGSEAEGKAHLRAGVRSDVPLLKQLFKLPPKFIKKKRTLTKWRTGTTSNAGVNTSPPNEHVHEHSAWMTFALEDLEIGLKRLVVGAKDLHKIDDSKTVEEYYSEALAKMIKEMEVKFDAKYLE